MRPVGAGCSSETPREKPLFGLLLRFLGEALPSPLSSPVAPSFFRWSRLSRGGLSYPQRKKFKNSSSRFLPENVEIIQIGKQLSVIFGGFSVTGGGRSVTFGGLSVTFG